MCGVLLNPYLFLQGLPRDLPRDLLLVCCLLFRIAMFITIFILTTIALSSNEKNTRVADGSPSDHRSDILISTSSTDPLEPLIGDVQEPYNYTFNSTLLPKQADDGYDCECSAICLPLKVLLDGLEGQTFHNTDGVILQLFQWAKSVSWTSVCLVHLQRLAELKFGNITTLWSREETIKQLEGLLLDSLLLEANISLLPCLSEQVPVL